MIHSFDYCVKKHGTPGYIEEMKKGIVKVRGLTNAVIGEGVTFETGDHGRVMSIGEELTEVLVLSNTILPPNTPAARTGSLLTISCGEGLLGHIVNTLGHSISHHRDHSADPEQRIIEVSPVGIAAREKVNRFFETGTTVVDLFIPNGEGQRELILGDRKSGKTHFILQTLLTQARKDTVCLYVAIGKRKTEVKQIETFITENNIAHSCIILSADSEASAGEVFLSPFSAMTIAEYFRDQGRKVLIIFDDLTTHAKYYREISLLSGNFTGRESYPGDIFQVYSQLLERAGSFHVQGKNVTITCLPVAESVDGDFTGFIPTTLMSMTDGHIYFDSDLFFEGRRPAINIFLSVTRVGRQTQTPLFRDITKNLLIAIKKYAQAERFLRFGPEISPEVKKTLQRGTDLYTYFSQVGYETMPHTLSAILISLLWQDVWHGEKTDQAVKAYETDQTLKKYCEELVQKAQSLEELVNLVAKDTPRLITSFFTSSEKKQV